MSADESVKDQARYWLMRQHSGEMGAQERAALQGWLQADERHRREFEQVSQLWNAMEAFGDRDFPARRAARRHRGQPWRLHALQLASLALLAIAALLVVELGGWKTSEEHRLTGIGERSAFVLADGSRVELNTDSEVRIVYTRRARTVYLDRGEAYFTVTPDSSRPFEVHAGSGRIVDLSTAFNVLSQDGRVEVTVGEGAVRVSTQRTGAVHLLRGDAFAYGASGEFLSRHRVDPQSVTAWREGRMKFDATPLSEVMAQVARYHSISYAFSDPGIGDMRVSGSFRNDDIQLLLHTLEAALPVQASIDGSHVQIRGTRQPIAN